MKILVATTETQGDRANDFFWTNEGEILLFGFECDSDHGNPDGSCGCARSMSGIESKKGCTTFKVVDRDMTVEDLGKMLYKSKTSGGWTVTEEGMLEQARMLVSLVGTFEAGMVVEKRGDVFQERHRSVSLN